jgi:hypothetical protein
MIQLMLRMMTMALLHVVRTSPSETVDAHGHASSSGLSLGHHSAVHGHQLTDAIHKATLAATTGYQTIGARNIRKGLFYGDEERLKVAMHRLLKGDLIKISAVGGSITQGQGLGDGDYYGVERYTERIAKWAKESGLKVNVTNGGFAACSSSYFASCVNMHVPMDADLVIVELAANDPWAYANDLLSKKAFERLIRKLMDRPAKPAIILVNAYQHTSQFGKREQEEGLYLRNSEAYFFEVASYYSLSLASTKAAVWHLSQASVPGFLINSTWYHQIWDVKNAMVLENPPSHTDLQKYLFWDSLHFTSVNGHRAMSELIIGLLVHASRQLLVAHDHTAEDQTGIEALPPPIFKGNEAPRSETCLVGEALKASSVNAKGFNWVNEARPDQLPKWGFTGFKSGSELKIKIATDVLVDLSTPANESQPLPNVTLSVGYLSSYDPIMADFEVYCESGCLCERRVFEGLDKSRKVSQMAMRQIEVSPSPDCIIGIKIKGALESSRLPECKVGCKVKIGAMVLEDSAGWSSAYIDMDKLDLMSSVFGPGSKEFGTKIKKPT